MHTEYIVIPGIDARNNGPVSTGPAGDEQQVHLRQGDIDGACGPYTVLMALLALGIVDRDVVVGRARLDKRTSVGKLIARMEEGWSTLFRDGTDLTDLGSLLEGLFRTRLVAVPFAGNGTQCRSFVRTHLLEGSPVIVGTRWDDGAHFVLAIGIESAVDDGTVETCRFLVLDPSDPPPSVSPWNGIIDARGSGGRYPYTWWTDGNEGKTKVALETALALRTSTAP